MEEEEKNTDAAVAGEESGDTYTETTDYDYANSDDAGDEEEELPPPNEKNEARMLNIGNIFAVIFIAVILVILFIMVLSRPKKEAKNASELDKAGSKYIPDVRIAERTLDGDEGMDYEDEDFDDDEDSINEILKTLPPEFKPQDPPSQAPVAPIGSSLGSSSSYTSDRPDTRNSRSPRRVDGIAGQNYAAQSANNQNIVSAMMNGNGFSQPSGQGYGNGLTKDEYMAQLASRASAAANSLGASYGNNNMAHIYQSNKEAFFGNGGGGNSGGGQYLSYASLWEGTIISGALQTAVNTDNPGLVIARVTENVYSSYDGSLLLIPEGSLLYATYNSSVSYGQKRVQIAWNLLIRPDGYRVQLGNMNGVDAHGASGARGRVSNHPFETLKALGLVAVFSIIQTEITSDIKSSNNEYVQNAMADTYSEASKLGSKILDKALDIKPTITIKPGTEIKLITNIPLELPPVKVNPVTRKYIRTR